MAREVEALQHFAGMPWSPPLLGMGEDHILLPLYDAESRLDNAASRADAETRREMARQAIGMLFDIFMANRAHRDVHARNLFWERGQLIAVDFECMTTYPEGQRPSFPLSYDLTGEGLSSPHGTGQMSWDRDTPSRMALRYVLGIDSEAAVDMLRADLTEELHHASLSFNKLGRRHVCQSGMIYASFALPEFEVPAQDSQRDTARRWERFGLAEDEVRSARLLDLGCNAGATLFHAAGLQPSVCLGVEYDQVKVDIANRIAAFNGLASYQFMQADIDGLDAAALGEPYDVVFCLALEAHLQHKRRLYKLLAATCRDTLIFEGNSTTNMADVQRQLEAAGFDHIERLGVCDDDRRPENNTRELLKARRIGGTGGI